ncbi:MAG TPA: hypothetical protein VLQ65_10960 [Saliniramus sp.]|nr:hypothetical protein [Saliniramus sp.]
MIKLATLNTNQQELRTVASSAFNLFRRKDEPELLCAVPEDRIVPSFIAGETWEFGGTITGSSREHPGFDAGAARAAARYNGFYLFQAWKPCEPHPIRTA